MKTKENGDDGLDGNMKTSLKMAKRKVNRKRNKQIAAEREPVKKR